MKTTNTKSAVKTQTGRSKLASIVAGTAMSAASLLGASFARATTITRQAGGQTTSWSDIATTSSERISISDATLTNPAGTLSRGDAFDGALNVTLVSTAGSSDDALIDPPGASISNNSPNGGAVSGRASASVNGTDIGVEWALLFDSSAAQVTGIFIVTNNSASTFDGFVDISTNFGSDSSTVVEASSSGDATIADGDSWVVTSEGSGESSGDDPVILSIIDNANALIGPDTDLNSGDDDLVWRVPVSLAPGANTTVTARHCLFETIAEAQAAGVSGNCGAPIAPSGPAVAVPVMQNPALLALAILTGLLGTGSLVGRRKKVQK